MNYIYMLTFPNGKYYIGETIDIKRRMNQYRKYNCKSQKHLYNALKLYDFNNIQIRILTTCEKNKVKDVETYFIDSYASNEKHIGYNIIRSNANGSDVSKETCLKISKSNKGRIFTDEHRRNMSISRRKRIISDETRKKMSVARKGIKFSDEHKNNLKKHSEKEVIQLDLYGNILNEYKSIKEASYKTNSNRNRIGLICRNGKGLTNNYHWKFKINKPNH